MQCEKRLNELYKKQIEKKKLNQTENDEVYRLICRCLNETGNPSQYYEFIMTFLPDAGVRALADYLSRTEEYKRKDVLEDFLNSRIFTENRSNMSLKRGMALAAMLLDKGCSHKEICSILARTCEVTMNTTKTGVNSQITGYVRKEFLERSDTFLSAENILCSAVSDREYSFIERIFFNTVFADSEKVRVSARQQFSVLKWLASMDMSVTVTEGEREVFNRALAEWPGDLAREFVADHSVFSKFGKFINFSLKQFEAGELYQIPAGKEKRNNNCPEDTEHSTETEQITQREDDDISASIEDIIEMLGRLKKTLAVKEKELSVTKDKLAFYITEYEKLRAWKEDTEQKIMMLKDEISDLKQKNINFSVQLKELTGRNTRLTRELDEYRDKLKIMHETSNLIENKSLQDFKNRLANRLRVEYMDFMEVENCEINSEMAGILKIQISNIFRELKRQGIIL